MADDTKTEIKLREAVIRLIKTTDGATSLDDVERIRGTKAAKLLADESGVDYFTVARITGLPL